MNYTNIFVYIYLQGNQENDRRFRYPDSFPSYCHMTHVFLCRKHCTDKEKFFLIPLIQRPHAQRLIMIDPRRKKSRNNFRFLEDVYIYSN